MAPPPFVLFLGNQSDLIANSKLLIYFRKTFGGELKGVLLVVATDYNLRPTLHALPKPVTKSRTRTKRGCGSEGLREKRVLRERKRHRRLHWRHNSCPGCGIPLVSAQYVCISTAPNIPPVPRARIPLSLSSHSLRCMAGDCRVHRLRLNKLPNAEDSCRL